MEFKGVAFSFDETSPKRSAIQWHSYSHLLGRSIFHLNGLKNVFAIIYEMHEYPQKVEGLFQTPPYGTSAPPIRYRQTFSVAVDAHPNLGSSISLLVRISILVRCQNSHDRQFRSSIHSVKLPFCRDSTIRCPWFYNFRSTSLQLSEAEFRVSISNFVSCDYRRSCNLVRVFASRAIFYISLFSKCSLQSVWFFYFSSVFFSFKISSLCDFISFFIRVSSSKCYRVSIS